MLDSAHTCLAESHKKRTWLIDSPSKPHTLHLESIFIPLFKISSTTGTAPERAFQRKVLILGEVLSDQTSDFRAFKDGAVEASLMSKEFLELFSSQ